MSETELHYMPHFYHVYQGYHPPIYEQISADLKTHYGRFPLPTQQNGLRVSLVILSHLQLASLMSCCVECTVACSVHASIISLLGGGFNPVNM